MRQAVSPVAQRGGLSAPPQRPETPAADHARPVEDSPASPPPASTKRGLVFQQKPEIEFYKSEQPVHHIVGPDVATPSPRRVDSAEFEVHPAPPS